MFIVFKNFKIVGPKIAQITRLHLGKPSTARKYDNTIKFFIENDKIFYYPRPLVTTFSKSKFAKRTLAVYFCLGPPGLLKRLGKGECLAACEKSNTNSEHPAIEGRERAASGPRQGRIFEPNPLRLGTTRQNFAFSTRTNNAKIALTNQCF